MLGGEGNDESNGGKGNDELDGGEGKDKLKGGKGADTFLCDIADKITDFDSAEGDKKTGQCSAIDEASPSSSSPQSRSAHITFYF